MEKEFAPGPEKSPEKENEIVGDIKHHLEAALADYFSDRLNIFLHVNDAPEMLKEIGVDEEKIKGALRELDNRLKFSGQKGFLE